MDPSQFIQNTQIPQSANLSITGNASVGGGLELAGQSVYNLFPFYRITSNQVLQGTVTGTINDSIYGWGLNTPCGVHVTYIQTVNDNVPWASRSAEEKSLLAAMGRDNIQYVRAAFNIYRLSWTNNGCWTIYQTIPSQPSVTVAAFTKLESGSISQSWTVGIKNTWSLTGTHYGPTQHGYLDPHPYSASVTGSILFAMPAAVVGWVDLSNPINWGFFPYVDADSTL